MKESMVDRVCNQYKKVVIEAFKQNGIFSNSLMIKLVNSMIGIAQPGDQIEVVGIVVTENEIDKKKRNYPYLANIVASSIKKIHQINGVFDLLKNTDLFGLSNAKVPRNITHLLESERSPYSTGQSIVNMFLNDWLPDNLFRKLRLSLLLSLVSTSPEVCKGINLMIVSDTLNPLIIRILHRAGMHKRFMNWNLTSDRIPITDGVILVQINNMKDLRKTVHAITEIKTKKSASIWGLSFSKDILAKAEFKVNYILMI